MKTWIEAAVEFDRRYDYEAVKTALGQYRQFGIMQKWPYLHTLWSVEFIMRENGLDANSALDAYNAERAVPMVVEQSTTKSMGLGDTIAKISHAVGMDKLAEKYTEITGKPCGCQERQALLNKIFPYGEK